MTIRPPRTPTATNDQDRTLGNLLAYQPINNILGSVNNNDKDTYTFTLTESVALDLNYTGANVTYTIYRINQTGAGSSGGSQGKILVKTGLTADDWQNLNLSSGNYEIVFSTASTSFINFSFNLSALPYSTWMDDNDNQSFQVDQIWSGWREFIGQGDLSDIHTINFNEGYRLQIVNSTANLNLTLKNNDGSIFAQINNIEGDYEWILPSNSTAKTLEITSNSDGYYSMALFEDYNYSPNPTTGLSLDWDNSNLDVNESTQSIELTNSWGWIYDAVNEWDEIDTYRITPDSTGYYIISTIQRESDAIFSIVDPVTNEQIWQTDKTSYYYESSSEFERIELSSLLEGGKEYIFKVTDKSNSYHDDYYEVLFHKDIWRDNYFNISPEYAFDLTNYEGMELRDINGWGNVSRNYNGVYYTEYYIDYFTIDFEGGLLELNLQQINSFNNHIALNILDENNNYIGSTADSKIFKLSTGTYQILISPGGTTIGDVGINYNLSWNNLGEAPQQLPDIYETNDWDNPYDLTDLLTGGQFTVNANLNNDDDDFYKITNTNYTQLNLDLLFNVPDGDYFIEIYDTNLDYITGYYDNNYSNNINLSIEQGDYYIGVYYNEQTFFEDNNYQLSIDLS
ncbi:hypothetical protein [Geminocystis sp. NIES-3709]|uniref:hypothetical protein n=1 Tax=Geminocystis sp. NIES-3709 TaxID=1617448 RepID=UPI0005FC8C58|nr:hypothetical protein [Geminocystis sp. NIES-3709]BAQ63940.1 hypothetical protein GM3709_705 [Geminocystis sp. NIES-3709]